MTHFRKRKCAKVLVTIAKMIWSLLRAAALLMSLFPCRPNRGATPGCFPLCLQCHHCCHPGGVGHSIPASVATGSVDSPQLLWVLLTLLPWQWSYEAYAQERRVVHLLVAAVLRHSGERACPQIPGKGTAVDGRCYTEYEDDGWMAYDRVFRRKAACENS